MWYKIYADAAQQYQTKIRIIIKTTPNGRKEDEEAFYDQITTVPDNNMTTIDNHMTH